MLERLHCGSLCNLLPAPGAERAAGCGEMQFYRLVVSGCHEALEDGGVLRVHRQYHGLVGAHGVGDDLPCGHERFLVCQRHYLPCFQGGQSWPKAGEADHGAYHNIYIIAGHQRAKAVGAGENLDALGLQFCCKCGVFALVADYHRVGVELHGLPGQQLGIAPCREHHHLEHVGMLPYDIQGLGAYGTGGTEYGYATAAFHQNFT